ncbi:MAG: PQQ-binding-like beta-propeller repeat protein [Myxococcales bacterium]|nr:MAG: PQQ-binding-like beta-propeller repeat protein [Myxococcales bacterium]
MVKLRHSRFTVLGFCALGMLACGKKTVPYTQPQDEAPIPEVSDKEASDFDTVTIVQEADSQFKIAGLKHDKAASGLSLTPLRDDCSIKNAKLVRLSKATSGVLFEDQCVDKTWQELWIIDHVHNLQEKAKIALSETLFDRFELGAKLADAPKHSEELSVVVKKKNSTSSSSEFDVALETHGNLLEVNPVTLEQELMKLATRANKSLTNSPQSALSEADDLLSFHALFCREAPGGKLLFNRKDYGIACGRSEAAALAFATKAAALVATQKQSEAARLLTEVASSAFSFTEQSNAIIEKLLEQKLGSSVDIKVHTGPIVQGSVPSAAYPGLNFVGEETVIVYTNPPKRWSVGSSAFDSDSTPASRPHPLSPNRQLAVVNLHRSCAGYAVGIAPASWLSDTSLGLRYKQSVVFTGSDESCKLSKEAEADTGGWNVFGWTPSGIVMNHAESLWMLPVNSDGESTGELSKLGLANALPKGLSSPAVSESQNAFVIALPGGAAIYRSSSPNDAILLRPKAWAPPGYRLSRSHFHPLQHVLQQSTTEGYLSLSSYKTSRLNKHTSLLVSMACGLFACATSGAVHEAQNEKQSPAVVSRPNADQVEHSPSLPSKALIRVYRATGRILWSPLFPSKKSIVLSSTTGQAIALDKQGKRLWEHDFGRTMFGASVLDQQNNVVLVSDDGTVRSFSSTGQQRWSYAVHHSTVAGIRIDQKGRLFVPSLGLVALNSEGKLLWHYMTASTLHHLPAFQSDGKVIIGTLDGIAHGINHNGRGAWRYDTKASISAGIAVGPDDSIYLPTEGKGLVALDAQGKLRWEFPLNLAIRATPLVFQGKRTLVVFGCDDHMIYALRAQDGSLAWKIQSWGAVRASPSNPQDELIFIGSDDGFVYLIDPDGKLRYKIVVGQAVRSAVVASPWNWFYFGADDGWLYAFHN